MGFKYYNPNPKRRLVGDCVIRAISVLTNLDWEEIYLKIAIEGMELGDMPSANNVWGSYLKRIGYTKHAIPDSCPDCYSVKEFCREYPIGSYLLSTGAHVVSVIDGDYYDTWDSGDEVPVYYWRKED